MANDTYLQSVINNPRKFMLLESTQIPLAETSVDNLPNKERVLANMINPITGKPYEDGILLSGVFADLRPELNRNNRIYSIPEYIELVNLLYKQIFSKRGLFGEFEHPEKYGTDGKKVSHKILDIFYDPKTMMVYGTVLVLDSPNGKIVKEIIKSGGLVCISGRAAGSETKQSDGTLLAVTKLLITYDLVMNPGFNSAELNYVGESKTGFSVMLYESQMDHFNSAYSEYISLNENINDGCFIEWYAKHNLNESDQQDLTSTEEDAFQEMEIPKQQQQQHKLQKVTDAQLKQTFLNEANGTLTEYYRRKKLAGAVHDNSAGFLTTNPDGNTFQSFLDMCAQDTDMFLYQAKNQSNKSQGLSDSDYLNKDTSKHQAKATETKATETKATETKATETKATETKATETKATETKAKPNKKSLGTKIKDVGTKAKDIGKKNARYYLNLDMDDGNSNAGKAIIQK